VQKEFCSALARPAENLIARKGEDGKTARQVKIGF
jgi:hypothetical protein